MLLQRRIRLTIQQGSTLERLALGMLEQDMRATMMASMGTQG